MKLDDEVQRLINDRMTKTSNLPSRQFSYETPKVECALRFVMEHFDNIVLSPQYMHKTDRKV